LKNLLKIIFLTDDKKKPLQLEPFLIILACALNVFEKTWFHLWLGWFFLVLVVVAMPFAIVRSIKWATLRKEGLEKEFPELAKDIVSHKAFVRLIYHATFLFFWWKWL